MASLAIMATMLIQWYLVLSCHLQLPRVQGLSPLGIDLVVHPGSGDATPRCLSIIISAGDLFTPCKGVFRYWRRDILSVSRLPPTPTLHEFLLQVVLVVDFFNKSLKKAS